MKSHGIAAGLLFGLAGLCMGQLPASAQSDYPNKAITMIVPFPAGGRTDVVGRIVAQELAKKLGKPVAVVNKPGASSVLGRVNWPSHHRMVTRLAFSQRRQ